VRCKGAMLGLLFLSGVGRLRLRHSCARSQFLVIPHYICQLVRRFDVALEGWSWRWEDAFCVACFTIPCSGF
jgi:hypothetical protein